MGEEIMKTIFTSYLVQTQLFLLIICVVALVFGKFGLLSPLTAFYTTVLCTLALLGVFGMSGIRLLLLIKQPEVIKAGALIAMGLGMLPLVAVVLVMSKADFSRPMIHDITTDLNEPPQFIEALKVRKSSENSLVYNKNNIEIQLYAYSAIKPVVSAKPYDEIFSTVLSLIEKRDWLLLNSDASTGIVEAVDETKIFGFKDDVAIRIITSEDGTSRIDMRSASRVGKGDLGANAKRITQFMVDLRTALSL